MPDRPRYMISVAAELVGMHPQTLRIYEAKGLVRPGRTPGGTRLYSERDLERLRLIQRLTTELGLNLAGVQRVLALEDELQKLRNQIGRLQRQLRAEAGARLAQKPRTEGAAQQPQVSAQVSRLLDRAFDEAQKLGDEYVSVEHLLLALDVVPRDDLLARLQQVRGAQRVTSQDPE